MVSYFAQFNSDWCSTQLLTTEIFSYITKNKPRVRSKFFKSYYN